MWCGSICTPSHISGFGSNWKALRLGRSMKEPWLRLNGTGRAAGVRSRREIAIEALSHAFACFCTICANRGRFRPQTHQRTTASWWVSFFIG